MKQINLVKFGFIRSPEDDFSDDGSRFTCYRVGNMRVSKLLDHRHAYIAGRYEGKQVLEYEEYSKLPHYKVLDHLNGIPADEITEKDLQELYDGCVAFEQEYNEAASKVTFPTVDEIANARRQVRAQRAKELKEVVDRINTNPIRVLEATQSYAGKNLVSYMKSLKQAANPSGTDEDYAKSILGSAYSRTYVKPAHIDYELKSDFYYQQCMEYLSSILR